MPLLTARPSKLRVGRDAPTDVFLMFTFRPPEPTGNARPALDVAVALDVSGSMTGEKIASARASLTKLVEQLGSTDHLAVITFDSHVAVPIPRAAMTSAAKAEARSRILALQAGTSTNLSGGILQALQLLPEPPGDAVRRCMVFTDGHQNMGIRDPQELLAAVASVRRGVPISSFGYGNDHDPALLASLAMDGGFYYIDGPDKIPGAFGAELGGLLATWAQNVALRVEPGDGVEILGVENDLPTTRVGAAVVVRCDDLLAGQPYSVVLALRTSGHDTTLARARASYFNVGTRRMDTAELSVGVELGFGEAAHAPAVLDEVVYQRSVQAQKQALAAARKGDLPGAREALSAFTAFAIGVGTPAALDLAKIAQGLIDTAYLDERTFRGGGHQTSTSAHTAMKRKRDFSRGTIVGGVDLGKSYGSAAQDRLAQGFGDAPDDSNGGKGGKQG